ncbi:hypothetical protein Pyrde_1914 [Pyrodictium delaneyi]|uniref:Uncharacterized protein n=1 Tax=Pyrodictium delaneyi TaxID=1273541 RepID=A0A0P0N5X9_9CREN|nr:hypothetical protein [Pyrodictium delaneyi]ALL01957.1 hypothetical protein Pyrde_1914 [Pyrodictium delaneyi]OWJ54872.1 hypothetical protein Pdsh_03945 [Pyrodictium delaneyi]
MAGSLRLELDGEAARALESLARATGRPAREVVERLIYAASGIVEPVPPSSLAPGQLSLSMLVRLVSSSALLAEFIDYAVFRGFLGLLETMSVENVVCYVPSKELQEKGCSATNGASIELVASGDEAPFSSLSLGVVFPADGHSHAQVEVQGDVIVEVPEGVGLEEAVKIARRVVGYARRTRLYRELEDYLASDGDMYYYSVDINVEGEEPLDRDGGYVAVAVEVEAEGLPGLLLPFDLAPVLGLARYIRVRLGEKLARRG